MVSAKRALKKPELIYEAVIQRRPYFRRFRFTFFILIVAALAWAALEAARRQSIADPIAIDVGWLSAMVLTALLTIHVIVNFFRWRTRRNEHLRFYDQGFVWQRGGARRQYGWAKLVSFREGGRGLYLRQKPLVQWGAHTLTMSDGEVYRVTPQHGDLRRFARAARPYAAEVTGTRMGRQLRQSEKPIRLHRQLVLWPGGVEVGKKEIHWSKLDAVVARNRLMIREKDAKGRFKVVKRLSIHKIDNAGGFIELVGATIRNYQRERFEKPAKTG